MWSQSGGLFYHLKSLRARGDWTPFYLQMEKFLHTISSQEQKKLKHYNKLVCVGPSAAYTFPIESILQISAKNVEFYEADPVAALLLKRKISRLKISEPTEIHFQKDFWKTPVPLEKSTLFVFCNVIGQWYLEGTEGFRHHEALKKILNQGSWISWHDRALVTGEYPFWNAQQFDHRLADQELDVLTGDQPVLLEYWDYGDLWDEVKRSLDKVALVEYLPWKITKARTHWIEAFYQLL